MRLTDTVSKTLGDTVSIYLNYTLSKNKNQPLFQVATSGAQPSRVTIKFSGDGAVIAASATMVFLTFSFPGLANNVLSATGLKHSTLFL